VRLTRTAAGYQVQALHLFNCLQNNGKTLSRAYRAKMKAFLTNKAYYTIPEFRNEDIVNNIV
jgi:hypothetical protein